MASITLKAVRKSFQTVEIIHGIDLVMENGAFTVLVGPSGCGKSTLLRMIAGLEEVSSGEIQIDGVRCDHMLPAARGMAMVFQSYALYPHMSVGDNLRFGLENQRLPRREIEARVARAAEILQISHLLKRRPHQLSGGQSQRVAIGRAIVKEPKAFLFDEPLSNLDAELRVKMRSELVALHERLGSTMVYVTHDQVEAMTMADRIVVLCDGRVEQAGSPVELYTRPANRFVAGFLGAPQMNFLGGRIEAGTLVLDDDGTRLTIDERTERLPEGGPATLGIRPEHIFPEDNGPLRIRVVQKEILGAETIVHGRLAGGAELTLSLRGIAPITADTALSLAFAPADAHLFDADGRAIT